MSGSFFDSLTSEEQNVVLAAGKEATAYAREVYDPWEASSKEKASAGGAQFVQLDPGAEQGFVDTLKPVYKKHASKVDGGIDMLNQIEALGK